MKLLATYNESMSHLETKLVHYYLKGTSRPPNVPFTVGTFV